MGANVGCGSLSERESEVGYESILIECQYYILNKSARVAAEREGHRDAAAEDLITEGIKIQVVAGENACIAVGHETKECFIACLSE